MIAPSLELAAAKVGKEGGASVIIDMQRRLLRKSIKEYS
jgi:hypothetical protein